LEKERLEAERLQRERIELERRERELIEIQVTISVGLIFTHMTC